MNPDAKIISIDLGMVNLAYSLFASDGTLLDFELINPHTATLSAYGRCEWITKFLKGFQAVDQMIIEKQTPNNIVCFAMMYGFVSAFMVMHPEGKVRVVDPVSKFNNLNVKCDTKNKNHKKLMIQMVKEILSETQLAKFTTLPKQDDVADCIMQFIGT
jgi:hypothetical protein